MRQQDVAQKHGGKTKMRAFREMMTAMKKSGQWKFYPDGSIFDIYGNEILPKAEIKPDHHRFIAMTPARIEHLSNARGIVLGYMKTRGTS